MRNCALQPGSLIWAAIALLTCLFVYSTRSASTETTPASNSPREAVSSESAAEGVTTLILYAYKSFYRERPEPEETLLGILRESSVRTGPNTRDMPYKLETDQGSLNVYVTGVDVARLKPLSGQTVRVIGKRIDQTAEGFGIEIWIASVAELDE